MYLAPLARLGTPRFRRFILNVIPWKPLHELRDISDVFYNTAVEIVNSKKRALKDGDEAVARQIGQGNDILSILSRFLIPRLRMGSLLTINQCEQIWMLQRRIGSLTKS